MIDITIIDILLALFMTKITYTYIGLFGKPRHGHPVWLGSAWFAYMCFILAVTSNNAAYPRITLAGNFLFVVLLYRLAHGGDLKTAAFHAGVFCAAWMAIELAVYTALLLMIPNTEDLFIPGDIIVQIIIYASVLSYGRFMPKESAVPLPLRCWLELFIVPIISVYVIYDTYIRSLTHGFNITFIVVSFLMVFMNLIIFDVYERMMSHMLAERENLIYEQEIEMCNRQANDRETAYRQTRMLRHDLNDRLIGISALLESGRSDEAEREIGRMLAENRLYRDEVSHSGNLALDALINYKHSLAVERDILMDCRTEVPAELFVDGTDLCIILGNLLDNALEAVEDLPVAQRWIKLEAHLEKGTMHIGVENPYAGKIEENTDGTIKSSKGSKEIHGYGLASVRRTVQKYNGCLIIRHDGGVFRASVMLCPKYKID